MLKRDDHYRPSVRIGVDTGGTFTDFVRLSASGLVVDKRRSTPDDPSRTISGRHRRRYAPYGARGGKPGGRGRNTLIRGGKIQKLPGKVELRLRRGDRLRIETPGGGGYGLAP